MCLSKPTFAELARGYQLRNSKKDTIKIEDRHWDQLAKSHPAHNDLPVQVSVIIDAINLSQPVVRKQNLNHSVTRYFLYSLQLRQYVVYC